MKFSCDGCWKYDTCEKNKNNIIYCLEKRYACMYCNNTWCENYRKGTVILCTDYNLHGKFYCNLGGIERYWET